MIFWAFVALIEFGLFTELSTAKTQHDVFGVLGAMAIWPFIAVGFRKYRRWLYRRRHTVYVEYVQPGDPRL